MRLSLLHKNSYWILCYRLLSVLLLFFITRLLFFIFNYSYFNNLDFWKALTILKGGFRFDMVAILYTNSLFILLISLPIPFKSSKYYQKLASIVFYVTNSIALLFNVIDFLYFRFTLQRITFATFAEVSNMNNFGTLLGGFIFRYGFLTLLFALIVFSLYRLNRRLYILPNKKYTFKTFFVDTIAFLAIALIFITGVRGGDLRHSTRPIAISHAGEYASTPAEIALVLNTPFCIYRTIQNQGFERKSFFKEEDLNTQFQPYYLPDTNAVFKPKNIVIIIWESLSKEAVGGFNKDLENGTYKGYTPFLDSLMNHSYVAWHSFANGTKSIEAMPSVISSIPSVGGPFVLSPYSLNNFNSLPKLLKPKGYQSSFFHGAPNGSMGFQAFANLSGFDNYYGKDEYPNEKDFDSVWGIWDEEFLGFMAKKMKTQKQPFLNTIFTLSSHDPFKVPEKHKNKFKKGPHPIYECLGYTDYSLKKFFESIKNEAWFTNTIFVITADHTSSYAHRESYKNAIGRYKIPIIFYAPGDKSINKIENKLIQQTDILPSLMAYLGYEKPFVCFGKNVFSKNSNNFAFNYNNSTYQWYEDEYILQFDGNKTKSMFNFVNDSLLKKNLINVEVKKKTILENHLKGFIQQYQNRMIDNNLLKK